MSSTLIAFSFLFPGLKFNFLKKLVRTIPVFIIDTLILFLLHSILKDFTNPKRPCFADEYKVALDPPLRAASEPIKTK